MVVRDDGELLQAWADGRCAKAFEEIVRRHIDLVYATAVRSLGGDRQLADDVTQAVFLILSKKAGTIRAGIALPAWLHQTARYAAANARKVQSRRRHHEHVAAAQRTEAAMDRLVEPHLLPELDDAIASLSPADRTAVIARYLRGKDLITVASELGTTVDAAQKRLERAVVKMREFFIRRRTKSSMTGLTATLGTLKMTTAPKSMVESTLATIHGGHVSATVAGIAKGTKISMMIAKTKSATIMATSTLAVAAAIGIVCGSIISRSSTLTTTSTKVPPTADRSLTR